MRSSLYNTRIAFFDAISALGYAVYDHFRKVNDYPYIIIGEQTEQQNGDQGEFGQIATINIEIYNGWKSDFGVRDTSDDMVNSILEAIITNPHTLEIEGFTMPVLVLDNVMTNTDQTQTHTIQTTVLRFRMQLFEQAGVTYITDDSGNYLTDDSGKYIIL